MNSWMSPFKRSMRQCFRLARGNLLEYKPLGNWFGKIDDSILAQEIYPRRSAGASPEKSPVC